MTDTPDREHVWALDKERGAFRSALVGLGFSDDGTALQGPVTWTDEQQVSHTARVEVVITGTFPFAAPAVTIVNAGPEFMPTFHIERDGKLCLWPDDVLVHDAPWRDPAMFVAKVRGWFAQTAAGWPGDNDADLERYLLSNPDVIVLYDNLALQDDGYYQTSKSKIGVVTVGGLLAWRPNRERIRRKRMRRREQDLLWVVDVGHVDWPIRSFQDLQDASGHDCERVRGLIAVDSVKYVLVRYQRGVRSAGLVLDFPSTDNDGVPRIRACESADQSLETRVLRAGPAAPTYADKKVAVVGCGAIGSHVADLLFRSGVAQLTLIDPERYHPGNVVRHTADNAYAGASKVVAVRMRLEATGLAVDSVDMQSVLLHDPEQALALVADHDLVVDATAAAKATALLRWAAESTGKSVVSVCVQRQGGIARVDRFPLRDSESHLEAVAHVQGDDQQLYEQGCGSPVSTTPPLAVVKAATTACQVVFDELAAAPTLPATMLEVIAVQDDEPYTAVGMMTSR